MLPANPLLWPDARWRCLPDVFQRILMFLNPEIGQSVQRVYDLADLFLELPQDSALHLVRVWRLADRAEARATLHRAVHRTESRKIRRPRRRRSGNAARIVRPRRCNAAARLKSLRFKSEPERLQVLLRRVFFTRTGIHFA